jgi:hypothetical protein
MQEGGFPVGNDHNQPINSTISSFCDTTAVKIIIKPALTQQKFNRKPCNNTAVALTTNKYGRINQIKTVKKSTGKVRQITSFKPADEAKQ